MRPAQTVRGGRVRAMEGHGSSWKVKEGHGRSWKVMAWRASEGHAHGVRLNWRRARAQAPPRKLVACLPAYLPACLPA